MVGVSVRRGPDMVVAVLGILKAGGAYLPVLPSLPRDRAAVMLGDAAAAFLISDVSCGWAASVPDGGRSIWMRYSPVRTLGRRRRPSR
ncbi:hypothetical protein SHIRM173S_10143 [Streptomyces hirsutus]